MAGLNFWQISTPSSNLIPFSKNIIRISLPVITILPLLMGQPILPNAAIAGTCAGAACKAQRVEFTPGQRITIQVVNQTSSLVQVEKIFGTDAIPLRPGQEIQFERGGSTDPNVSIVFWDVTSLPLQARLSKRGTQTLRIELRPGGRPPGDRSLYIRDNGRVLVY
jgi:hypothetical protein